MSSTASKTAQMDALQFKQLEKQKFKQDTITIPRLLLKLNVKAKPLNIRAIPDYRDETKRKRKEYLERWGRKPITYPTETVAEMAEEARRILKGKPAKTRARRRSAKKRRTRGRR